MTIIMLIICWLRINIHTLINTDNEQSCGNFSQFVSLNRHISGSEVIHQECALSIVANVNKLTFDCQSTELN